jgi:hypothetical protein
VKTKLVVLLFLAVGIALPQVSVGIRIGKPPAPRIVRVQPRSPGEGYSWVAGYWYPVGRRYKWHEGYWSRPPHSGAHWVEPRHDGEFYHDGYWEGDHGQIKHDHQWDRNKDHNRDYNRNDHR